MGEEIIVMKQKFIPTIFSEGIYTQKNIKHFKQTNNIWQEIDIYIKQIKELFEITHPHLKNSTNYKNQERLFIEKHMKGDQGDWVYYPWNGNFIHLVTKNDYNLLRTNRNRNLILLEEQKKLLATTVGIVGLSLGTSIAKNLTYQGIAETMKLADGDSLETTNLNRLTATVADIGEKKITIAAKQIYEVYPYSKLHLFYEGLTKNNVHEFVHKKPQPKVIFEIIDDFEMKILLRLEARKASIPVVMFSNLGDSLLIDIERFDLDKKLPLFNGVLGELPEKILQKPNEDKNKYAVAMASMENIPSRAMASVKEINKTLVGRPQLASTITVAAGFAAYLTRKIILDKSDVNGRIRITFDNLFKRDNNK